jgi:SAM-dependent methyltransferase
LDYWEYTFHLVGDIRGKNVLEIGCGGGWITRMLALKGARVSACDVSLEGCRLTARRLDDWDLHHGTIAVMDAHHLGWADNSFDLVVVAGVLHHINIGKASEDIYRILKPAGRLVFYEPVKYGPVMWAIRQAWLRLHAMKEYQTTEHEEGLRESDLIPLKKIFASSFTRRFNFLAKTNRLGNRFGFFAASLRWIDFLLLTIFPLVRRYCTCIVGRFDKASTQ